MYTDNKTALAPFPTHLIKDPHQTDAFEVERIANTLADRVNGKPEPIRNGFNTFCPCHPNTQTPALSLILGDTGKLVVTCHKGCDRKDVLKYIRDNGLLSGNSSPLNAEQSRQAKEKREKEDANKLSRARQLYDSSSPDQRIGTYLNSRGITEVPNGLRFDPQHWHPFKNQRMPAILALIKSPLFFTIGLHRTYLTKDCTAKAPIENSKLILGKCGGGSFFVDHQSDVLIVGEGIESTLAAGQILNGEYGFKADMQAGINAAGVKSIKPFKPYKKIYIATDNDVAGVEASSQLANRLSLVNPDVDVAIAYPRSPLKDFADETLALANADAPQPQEHNRKVQKVSLAAPAPTPAHEAPANATTAHEAPANATPAHEAPANATTAHEAPANATPLELPQFVIGQACDLPVREWVYDSHYIKKYVTATVAPGGVGKSTLAMTEAFVIATGRPLLGEVPKQRVPVAYVNAEDPIEEIQLRAFAICKNYGITQNEIDGFFFTDSARGGRLVIAELDKDGVKINAPCVDNIKNLVKTKNIGVLIVDPFVSTHRVNENDNNQIDQVVKLWAQLAGELNISIELVAHTRKLNGDQISSEAARGASSLVAAARSVRVLNRMPKEVASDFGISTDDARNFYCVSNDKANLAPATSAKWRRNKGLNTENKSNDWVGVTVAWTPPSKTDWMHLDGLKRLQALIIDHRNEGKRYRESQQANDWIGHLIADVFEMDVSDKKHKAQIKAGITTWLNNGNLKVVTEYDPKSKREVKFIDNGNLA